MPAIPKSAAIVRFGDCALDVRTGELHRAGTRIRLQDQPLGFLTLLLEHHGDLITREEARRRLWPNGTVVDFEHGINATVKRLREALHDNAEQPRYVETVPRRGYRFIAPIDIVAPATPSLLDSDPLRPAGLPTTVAAPAPDAGAVPRTVPISAAAGSPLADASARYTVLEAIGIGGQGRVYRGRDNILERDVAIKFLPDWMAHDDLSLHRFRREAHAAAALDHPNVLAIHDLAILDGAPCLVAEFLEGQTLRATLQPPGLALPETVDCALQTLDGLAAAHAKGIVHRDLKPENIFITRDGRVKILDFGIAKAVDATQDAQASGALPSTTPGAVLGTMGYQSPEQARGEKVDARSDIFAFGTVLYEMLTGQHPFHRRSDAETIAAVVRLDPPPPSRLRKGVPASCDAIIAKTLEKDRNLRYQATTELKVDLLRVQRELAGRSSPAPERSEAHVADGAMESRPLRIRRIAVGAAAATIGLVALTLFAWSGPEPLPRFEAVQLTRGTGVPSEPALSADGRFVAYASDENGTSDIYVMDRRNRATIRRTDMPGLQSHPAWLGDTGDLLFVSSEGSRSSVWRMPALAGHPTRLLEEADEVSVSPDGQQIAFTRPSRTSAPGSARIWVAPLADLNRAHPVAASENGQWDQGEPAWSPDGRHICYRAQMELWVVPGAGGAARRVLSEGHSALTPAWSHDGGFVYFSSTRGGHWAIWRIDLASSLRDKLLFWRHPLPERVTTGAGSEQQPSLSRDGRFLAYSRTGQQGNIWLLESRSGTF